MNVLLAQAAAQGGGASSLITPGLILVLIAVATIAVSTSITMRHHQRKRAWEHAERMKAMELGHVLPSDQSSWARAAVCVAIGGFVPVAAFLFTWLATFRPRTPRDIWIAPMVVGAIAVVSGSRLARQLFAPTASPKADQHGAPANGKPAFDADVFDVVGRRG